MVLQFDVKKAEDCVHNLLFLFRPLFFTVNQTNCKISRVSVTRCISPLLNNIYNFIFQSGRVSLFVALNLEILSCLISFSWHSHL